MAVSPLHTPALYSTLLRALISAKIDGTISPRTNDGPNGTTQDQQHMTLASIGQEPKHDGMVKPLMFGTNMEPSMEFQSTGEMGPVEDMSTFPPRMAPSAMEDPELMSMESILSSDFWDSVLVPGT